METILTTTNQKIVVHCAMGMERSVLAVVWLMASKWRMRLEQSYDQIKKHRPIALNRLNWITM
jgi:protein-tyrosine phosphatase